MAEWGRTSKASESPTARDIAWAAGIWEGEGSVARALRAHRSINVRVIQNDPWILCRLQSLFGGSIGNHGSTCLHWSVSGSRARGFIYTIYSLLSPRRRDQIRKALGHNVIEEALPRGL